MPRFVLRLIVLCSVLVSSTFALDPKPAATFALDSSAGLDTVNAKAEPIMYRGRRAVHLVPPPGQENADADMLALIAGAEFKDGTIEVDVAGAPRAGAPADSRGFIGVAFRVQNQGDKAEFFYLRPTNARSDDQLRRNHSTQYISSPEFPWERLRKESPGVYESYVDLNPGAWTHLKIVVSGTRAQLYVNGATEPCLVVNDLKHGDTHGRIALWAHTTTDAYFSILRVK
jgi:hypothetical protein